MLAAYNFDETSGTTVLDYSGNARNAHSESPRSVGKNGSGASGPRMVLMGDASSIWGGQSNSGVASYIPSVRAMSCWLYVPGNPWSDIGVMVGLMSINNETAFGFYTGSGGVNSRFRNGSNTTYGGLVAGLSGTTDWHFVAMSWDPAANLVTLWWDGAQAGTYATTGSIRTTANDIFVCDPNANSVRVDDLRIYDTLLTTAQVQADMVTPVGSVTPVETRDIRYGTVTPAAQALGGSDIQVRYGDDLIWS
jgi:hypothetical protein